VNNHNKTTIFYVALLYDETAESFVCPFKTFLAAMLGKKPHIILSDKEMQQCQRQSIYYYK